MTDLTDRCVAVLESRSSGGDRFIVGLSGCPWTQRALALKFHTHTLMLDECPDGDALWKMMRQETGQRTVPYVLDGPNLIGGFTELDRHLKKNPR